MAGTVKIGGKDRPVEEFSARKVMRAPKILARAPEAWEAIVDAWHTAAGEFAQRHPETLERSAARAIHGPQPLMQPMLGPDGQPVRDGDGNPLIEPMRDERGDFVMGPDPLGHVSDEEWAAWGQKLVTPGKAPWSYLAGRTFPLALAYAEREVVQLLALCVVTNAEFAEAAKADAGEQGDGIDQLLERTGEEILDDATGNELFEIALVGGETLERQFREQFEALVEGERLKNLRSLAGLLPGFRQDRSSQSRTSPGSTPETPTTRSNGEPISPTNSTEPMEAAGTPSDASTEPVGASSSGSSPG